jgi:hypothetical protein
MNGDKEPEIKEEPKPEAEKMAEIEENPDLEDPRLFSPLQEPDRPAPSLRTHEEEGEPAPSEGQDGSEAKSEAGDSPPEESQ